MRRFRWSGRADFSPSDEDLSLGIPELPVARLEPRSPRILIRGIRCGECRVGVLGVGSSLLPSRSGFGYAEI
jgi:hypothetical protein